MNQTVIEVFSVLGNAANVVVAVTAVVVAIYTYQNYFRELAKDRNENRKNLRAMIKESFLGKGDDLWTTARTIGRAANTEARAVELFTKYLDVVVFAEMFPREYIDAKREEMLARASAAFHEKEAAKAKPGAAQGDL